jgi:urate oxidase
LAQRTRAVSIEDFAKELIEYLLDNHAQISAAHVDIERKAWSNIISSNKIRHSTSFIMTSNELQMTSVRRSRHGVYSIVSGLKNLTVMKTAHSSFEHFYKDKLTTLPEASDRLFGTSIQAKWTYDNLSAIIDYEKTRQQVRSLIIDIFAEHNSASVQHTLFTIGKFILDQVKSLSKVHVIMPNIHCIPVDLARFGEENKNEIFMPIDDPHGYIDCTVTRSSLLNSKL